MKASALIQARMESTRLPGKVLMDIEGKPMVWHVINRLKFSKRISEIILAISEAETSRPLMDFAKKEGVAYFRGSALDVLSRYYETAKKFRCQTIARITSDCPLIDPAIADLVIGEHFRSCADYTSNMIQRTFPYGVDVEVFNFPALKKAHFLSKALYQREHVTPYFYENPDKFNLHNVPAKGNLCRPALRLVVDEKEDLLFIRELYKSFRPKKLFSTEQVLILLKKKPDLLKINAHIGQKPIK